MVSTPGEPASSEAPPPPQAAYAAIAAATVLWSVNYTFAKMAVSEIDPFAVALVRILVATPLLMAAMAPTGRALRPSLQELRAALPLGLTGVLANQIFFITGIRRTTPAHSALVVAMLPVLVLILAAVLLKERLTLLKVAGVSLALSGVILISVR